VIETKQSEILLLQNQFHEETERLMNQIKMLQEKNAQLERKHDGCESERELTKIIAKPELPMSPSAPLAPTSHNITTTIFEFAIHLFVIIVLVVMVHYEISTLNLRVTKLEIIEVKKRQLGNLRKLYNN